jgi:hypothetical protein
MNPVVTIPVVTIPVVTIPVVEPCRDYASIPEWNLPVSLT